MFLSNLQEKWSILEHSDLLQALKTTTRKAVTAVISANLQKKRLAEDRAALEETLTSKRCVLYKQLRRS